MSNEFRWSVEDFLGKPPLDMILEGLGALCASPLEIHDASGGRRSLGPATAVRPEEGDDAQVLSPIEVEGREAGMVIGYRNGTDDQQVPMTVALAASLISQFLRSTRAVHELSIEVDRRGRGLSLLERLQGEPHAEAEMARGFLREALGLTGAVGGALFTREGEEGSARLLAWEGMNAEPRAGRLTCHVARTGRLLDLASLGRLPAEVRCGGEDLELEAFLDTPALIAPVRFGTRHLGVLWICGHLRGGAFTREDRELVEGLAGQLGLFLWSGRAVGILNEEAGRRRGQGLAQEVRACYTDPRPALPGLEIDFDEELAGGSREAPWGGSLCWFGGETDGSAHREAARAVAVRAVLEAELPRASDLAGLARSMTAVLARLETSDASARHGFLLCAPQEDGSLEIAWRGIAPPVLEGPEGEGSRKGCDPSGEPGSIRARLEPDRRIFAWNGRIHIRAGRQGG